MNKDLTPEERKIVETNMFKFQNKILEAFDKNMAGVGYLECENENCPCGQKKMQIGQFHVFMSPAPEFKVMAVCRDAIAILLKKYSSSGEYSETKSLFNPNLN